jgi:HD superfamily phosphodiesterase
MKTDTYFTYLENYVTALFNENPGTQYPYHNLAHTKKVVAHCEEMSLYYLLTENDHIILITAAWFHDTGHLFTSIAMHETESIHQLYKFTKTQGVPEADTRKTEDCISSTRVNQKPVSLLEQILCDADLYHLGTDEFSQTDELVKKEMEMRTGMNTRHWKEKSLLFLENHHFYTEYCQLKLNGGKQANIRKLKRELGY